jgi:hypothetical protein
MTLQVIIGFNPTDTIDRETRAFEEAGRGWFGVGRSIVSDAGPILSFARAGERFSFKYCNRLPTWFPKLRVRDIGRKSGRPASRPRNCSRHAAWPPTRRVLPAPKTREGTCPMGPRGHFVKPPKSQLSWNRSPLQVLLMSRIIELPDDVYESLEKVAREQGFTPVGWIANAVPPVSAERPLGGLLEGLTGTVNSAEVPAGERRHTPFSEVLMRKFEKQGLRGA